MRQVVREVAAAVERTDPRPDVVVLDATTSGPISVTVLNVVRDAAEQLERTGVTLWVASLPPRALASARRAPGWRDWAEAGRLHPTVTAALRAHAPARAPPA